MLRRRGLLRLRLSMYRSLVCVVIFAVAFVLLFMTYTNKNDKSDSTAASVDGVRHFNQELMNFNKDADVSWQAKNSRLMTCQLHGRIGNMMFAYASLVGIARRNARTPALPSRHFLRAMFRLRAADMSARVERRESVKERHAGAYDEGMEWVDSDADLVEIVGYYQSWKYFARVVDEIRREFVFQAEFQKAASRFLSAAIGDKFGDGVDIRHVVLVGVHVRVADMASNVSAALGYTVAPPGYLSAAMDYFKHEYSMDKLMFVLATDDSEWCNKNFPFPTDVPLVRTGKGPDVLDLAILSNCNHTILTVGTFGWWAGWLAGGKTVYYKNFPRPDSSMANEYRREDYYPSDWIGM